MKFSLLIVSSVITQSVFAFVPNANFGFSKATSQLFSTRIDSTEAVTAALAASRKFGATSKEARVAWEIVEEMDASDNSVAYSPSVDEDECLVTESADPTCQDYDSKMAELSKAVDNAQIHLDTMKRVYKEIQAVKIQSPPVPSVPVVDEKMLNLISEAKAASAKYGASSSEAKLLWENVEEMASANSHSETMKGALEQDECLLEMATACEALEEISRVLDPEKSSSG